MSAELAGLWRHVGRINRLVASCQQNQPVCGFMSAELAGWWHHLWCLGPTFYLEVHTSLCIPTARMFPCLKGLLTGKSKIELILDFSRPHCCSMQLRGPTLRNAA